MLGIHEAGAGMGIICSDSDAESATSMGRLLRCLSFLHRHDQSRGTTNLDAEWPLATRQPDPDPDPVVYFATPTRSPPGDRNLDDRHERCDHTAQQARTAYRTYADWEFGIHRPHSCWRELCLTTPPGNRSGHVLFGRAGPWPTDERGPAGESSIPAPCVDCFLRR